MESQKKCIIWGTELESERDISGNPLTPNSKYEYNSPRAGGKYLLSSGNHRGNTGKPIFLDKNQESQELNEQEKIRLSGYIAKQNLLGKTPYLDSIMEDKNWLKKLPPIPNPRERAMLFLEGLVKKTNPIGSSFTYESFLNNPISFFYPLSYSTQKEEMQYLLNYLEKLNFIHFLSKSGLKTIQVTVKGFEQINNLSKSVNSKTVFIAMWFNKSMDEVKRCIEKAVRLAGYSPLRIDDKQHNNKIDDEILNEIKKARFMICDLTSEKGKPRGSVYFEAGYAMGRGIDIIWTCQKGLEKEISFDIRQYNCLYWEKENMKDFVKKLQQRIENTII